MSQRPRSELTAPNSVDSGRSRPSFWLIATLYGCRDEGPGIQSGRAEAPPINPKKLVSSLSRSSVPTSASRRLRGTCCIGLKAVTVRITVPRSNWRSLKGLAFNGSLITRDRRLRGNEPR
jgi:hypothetical protein